MIRTIGLIAGSEVIVSGTQRHESCVTASTMSDEFPPLVVLGDDGSILCMDPVVSDLLALKAAAELVATTKWAPRLRQDFESFVASMDVALTEIYAGEWDQQRDLLKALCQGIAVDLEQWKNKSEREKFATALKAEALTPLLIQEAKYLERSNAGANVLFETCAALLNGKKPRKPHTDDEVRLIQDTREKLLALWVGPDFRPSFDKWFVPGEAKDIVRWARKSDAEMDSILAKKAEQIAELIATSAS